MPCQIMAQLSKQQIGLIEIKLQYQVLNKLLLASNSPWQQVYYRKKKLLLNGVTYFIHNRNNVLLKTPERFGLAQKLKGKAMKFHSFVKRYYWTKSQTEQNQIKILTTLCPRVHMCTVNGGHTFSENYLNVSNSTNLVHNPLFRFLFQCFYISLVSSKSDSQLHFPFEL